MNAERVWLKEVRLYERNVTLRLPFRFGVVTLTESPQAFARVRLALADGSEGWGMAAEMLAPKWFDKSPELSNEDNFEQLRLSLKLASDAYLAVDGATPFALMARNRADIINSGATFGLNALTAGYGPALLDRAVLDAACRLRATSFWRAMQQNLAGMAPADLLPEFAGFDMDAFLKALAPRQKLHARHTVGMLDPLTSADRPDDAALNDGLPETLEEVIRAYGQRYFKLKVGGDLAQDLERLEAIAAVLDGIGEPYHATLDGNEQYDDVDGVLALTSAMAESPSLGRLCRAILFIEQPIRRASALARDVTELAHRFAVIIDESDDGFDVFPRAREQGYRGISSKTCKGFYKSLINAARCVIWNAEENGAGYFMSAEDLTCQPGVALQQDLALVALLGLTNVERNGHHYVRGMIGATDSEQSAFLSAHPDLYRTLDGLACVRIHEGELGIGSLACPGFAVGAEPDWTSLDEMRLPDAVKRATES